MDYAAINSIRLPTDDYSMRNSRERVMQHLVASTGHNEYNIWHIAEYDDCAILLFNVKDVADRHWLLALEVFLERKFNPLIPSLRNR
jgi:hypothetical protein